MRYSNAKTVNAAIFDHTNGAAAGYSERLNGSANEKYGLARSLSVMPGDTIKMEVYAKYVDPTTSNWTGALSTLMSQIAANTAGVVVDGTAYGSSTASFPGGYGGLVSKSDNGAPKAYLNWLIFDRNFGFITGGFKQITTTAKEAGADVAHEKIQPSSPLVITQAGYVYVYLSNEETTYTREVYFDDFKVTQIKSPVVQTDDYYPFGLTFNSYVRENSMLNQYKYNGKEVQDELSIGWMDYGARMYMPEIGRWGAIDPMAEKYQPETPYNYAFNAPVVVVDPDGREGTIYLQVLMSKKERNSEKGKEFLKFVDKAVAGLNQLFKEAKIDLKVQQGSASLSVMSKSEFYNRDGANKNDSYGLIGSNSRLMTAAKEAEGKGWGSIEPEGVNGSEEFNSVNGKASKENRFFLLNGDNMFTNGNGEDFATPVDKLKTSIMHEDGHTKFGGYKPGYRSQRDGTHLNGTIMQRRPTQKSVYDQQMIDILKRIHGTPKTIYDGYLKDR